MGLESILLGLLGLGILVFIHELGHFMAARLSGIEVEAFSVGMGKVLIRKTIGKTEYRLSLIPLGGYCKMKGENFLLSALENPKTAPEPEVGSFYAASPLKRIFVAVAGPFFNLLLAFVLFFGLALTGYPYYGSDPIVQPLSTSAIKNLTQKYYPWMTNLSKGILPAEKAGFQYGDRLITVNDEPLVSFQDFQSLVSRAPLRQLIFKVDRHGEEITLLLTPISDPRKGLTFGDPVVGLSTVSLPIIQKVNQGSDAALAGLQSGDRIISVNGFPVTTAFEAMQLILKNKSKTTIEVDSTGGTITKELIPSGIQSQISLGIGFTPIFEKPGKGLLEALEEGYYQTQDLFLKTIKSIGLLFTTFNFSESLSGPIGVVVNTGLIAQSAFEGGLILGLVAFLHLSAFLSMGLFIMNLLPIPVLDGGTVLINLIQMLFKKSFKPIVYVRFQQIGLVFVFALLIFTTANDLIKLPFN